MTTIFRRLRPNHLAGQIAFLILLAIILFQLVALAALHLSDSQRTRLPLHAEDVAATSILAIDAAPISERPKILEDLTKATPWVTLSIQDRRPAPVSSKEHTSDVQDLKEHLWTEADLFLAAAPAEAHSTRIAIALRKGGYALLSPTQLRRPPRSDWPAVILPGFGSPWTTMRWLRAALFFLLCASILTIWVSNAVVAPLVKLARQAERLPNETGKQELIVEEGPQEVRDLSRALNRMQARIQAMIATRTHVLAAISHDLRTILTRLKLRAEFIGDEGQRGKMLHDINLMDAMLYKNLQNLRAERPVSERRLIDLDSVLQTVADQFSDLGHEVVYHGGDHQMILGSITEMQRVFSNLVENALTYARNVEISVGNAGRDATKVEVADDGPGIPNESKASVLEPFVRGQPARNMNEHSGFGLGLSIVRSLVESHGGTVQLLDREPHGLIARVVFPRADASSDLSESST
jgi:signal transduction histidine kinase